MLTSVQLNRPSVQLRLCAKTPSALSTAPASHNWMIVLSDSGSAFNFKLASVVDASRPNSVFIFHKQKVLINWLLLISDIDECQENAAICPKTRPICLNLQGSYTCQSKNESTPLGPSVTCPAGYKFNTAQQTCEGMPPVVSNRLHLIAFQIPLLSVSLNFWLLVDLWLV